jgi:ribonuclease R
MKQATYDETNVGHFGLASKAYLHFTSPIRRYPDLIVHRTVHDILSGGDPRLADRERLAQAALASSIAERMEVERAMLDLYRAFMMKDRIGERFEGTVTAVVGSGVFVQLDSPFIDVLVRLEDLGHDHWTVDDDTLRVVAARSGDVLALGDRIVVEVVDVSILRRAVYAKRVASEPSESRAKPAHRDRRERKRPRDSRGPRREEKARSKKHPKGARPLARQTGRPATKRRTNPKKRR